ncbi:MAG TPA: 2-amino-4-hydroxy-6-hydroxymethyldihydropteridine diphosphokinase [Chloroflexia bacterium]|nr:2-amino-4-hydroxy-6-hydroxymethyldihydropteridine diphosphokinase [Chloroflexia bacterium]
MALVYLSLGSNLGDRTAHLRQGLAALPAATGGRLLRVSRLYETAPWGISDQPAFLNLALALETALAPAALLAAVKRLEAQVGRTAGPRWGPRLLDIDILLYDALTIDEPDLTIPHPCMLERRFVLQPLADIWPAGTPLLGQPLASRLAAVADQVVTAVPVDREGGL